MSRTHHVTTGVFAPPEPARELTVTSADGVELYAQVHGPGDGPAIVLAHGWTCSTAFWGPVVRSLTGEGYRVVVYDQRGHGASSAGVTGQPTGYSPATLADDLCAVLDATLAPGEKAVIGGHSMGAMTIMAAAGRDELRDHGAALMLCSTGAHELAGSSHVLPVPGVRARAAAHRLVQGAPVPFGPLTPLSKKIIKYVTTGAGASSETVDAVARIVHACPRLVRGAWGRVLGELDLAARVPKLDLPTAVVAGTHDRLTPFRHAYYLAEHLPNLTALHKLNGLGHMTPMEAPEKVAEVLRELVVAELDGATGAAGAAATAGTAPKGEEIS